MEERYASDDYFYGTEPNDFLASLTERLPVGDTLCVAEGEGRNAAWLAEHGHRVTAVDASAIGLEKAQKLAQQRGVAITTEVAGPQYKHGVEGERQVVEGQLHIGKGAVVQLLAVKPS